jgi:tRNA(fMet)-specific endonuclease VapC
MFVVLDTNHFTEFTDASVLGRRLLRRMEKHQPEVFTCIVAVEETTRGWLALLHQRKPGRDQLACYAMFQRSIETLVKLPVLPFDAEAANHFHKLKSTHRRLGSMDLKIAAICLAHDATLLTRNISDFAQIQDLRVENWLD